MFPFGMSDEAFDSFMAEMARDYKMEDTERAMSSGSISCTSTTGAPGNNIPYSQINQEKGGCCEDFRKA